MKTPITVLIAILIALSASTLTAQTLQWKRTDIPDAKEYYYWRCAASGPVAFAASESGLYRSNDSGMSWSVVGGVFAGRPSYFVLHQGNTWFVETNEPNMTDVVDLFRSQDDGATWDSCGVIGGGALTANSQGLFLGGGFGGGLVSSTDGGFHWVEAYVPAPQMSRVTGVILTDSMVVSMTDSAMTYSLWISTNFGGSWTLRSFPPGGYSTLCADGAILFAANHTGIYRSLDKAKSWVRVSDDTDAITLSMSGRIVVSASSRSGLHVSFDEGNTWLAASDGLPNTTVGTVSLDRGQLLVSLYSGGVYRATLPAALRSPNSSPVSANTSLDLLPNPASRLVRIDGEGSISRLELIDELGRTVLSESAEQLGGANALPITVDLSVVKNGTYTCRVYSGESARVAKLVVSH